MKIDAKNFFLRTDTAKLCKVLKQTQFQCLNSNIKFFHPGDRIYNAKFTLYTPWFTWNSLWNYCMISISRISLLALVWNLMIFNELVVLPVPEFHRLFKIFIPQLLLCWTVLTHVSGANSKFKNKIKWNRSYTCIFTHDSIFGNSGNIADKWNDFNTKV